MPALTTVPRRRGNSLGGGAAAYREGSLYARSFRGDTEVYDATSGSALQTIVGGLAPAIGTLGYFVQGGELHAMLSGHSTSAWTFTGHGVVTAPVVAGGYVVVAGSTVPSGNNNTLWILTAPTGSLVATTTLPGDVLIPDEWSYTAPLTGMAVADGMLFVPTSIGLVAY